MHICPHCNQPGIAYLRKIVIGPAMPAVCKNCGGKVINSTGQANFAVVPFAAGLAGLKYLENPVIAWSLMLLGLFVTVVITTRWVKLVKK